MTRSYTRLLVLAFLGSCLVPLVTAVCSQLVVSLSVALLAKSILLAVAALIASVGFYLLLRRLEPYFDANVREQAEFLEPFPSAMWISPFLARPHSACSWNLP
jgi:hypothetical protein